MAVSRILRQILRLFRWGFQFVLHVPNRSCKGWCGNDVSHGHGYLKFGFSMIIICPWLVKVPSHGHERITSPKNYNLLSVFGLVLSYN
jgi:hypothetical protein